MKKNILKYIGLGILIIVGSSSLLKNCILVEEEGEVETRAKNEYSCISTEYLGKFLANSFPDSKALIIYDSVSTSKLMEQRMTGLRKGIEGKIEIVKELGFPTKIPKDIPPNMMRISDFVKAEDFNMAMKKYPQANLVISLIGLPEDIQEMQIWQIEDKKKRPKLAVFGGDIDQLANAIKADFIQALVVYRPMDKYVNQLPPSDLEEAFKRRFILITPQNIKDFEPKK